MDEAEKKAAAETAAAKAAEAASAEAKKKSDGVDYEAELKKVADEKAKKERELVQAQHTIVELKKKKDAEGTVDVASIVEERLAEFKKQQQAEIEAAKAQMASDAIEETLSELTDDPKARELILHHYENSILKTGVSKQQIREDLKKANVLAHRPIVERLASEGAAARASHAATATGYAGSQAVSQDVTGADDEAEIAKVMRITGAPYEAAKKLYLKNKSE